MSSMTAIRYLHDPYNFQDAYKYRDFLPNEVTLHEYGGKQLGHTQAKVECMTYSCDKGSECFSTYLLISYYTPVAYFVDRIDHMVLVVRDYHTITTQKHIRRFVKEYLPNPDEWLALIAEARKTCRKQHDWGYTIEAW